MPRTDDSLSTEEQLRSFIEKFETPIPPNEALKVQGFAGSEDASVSGPHSFRTLVNLDDCPQGTSTNECAGGRILADINMGAIPATGMDLTLRPIKTIKGFKVSGGGLNTQLASTMHMIIGVDSSTAVSPLSLEVHSGTDLNAVEQNSVPSGKPLTEAVIKARIDKLPAKTNLDINLDKNLSFGGDFHDQNGGNDTPGKVTITYSDVNDQHGNTFQDKPRTNPLVDHPTFRRLRSNRTRTYFSRSLFTFAGASRSSVVTRRHGGIARSQTLARRRTSSQRRPRRRTGVQLLPELHRPRSL